VLTAHSLCLPAACSASWHTNREPREHEKDVVRSQKEKRAQNVIFHGKIAKMHILAQFEPKVGAGIARGDTKFSILQRYSIANWAQYWAKMCILARLSRFWGPLGQNYELSAHSGA